MHNVGILGSAVVGQTLARGFKTHGHDVRIGEPHAGEARGLLFVDGNSCRHIRRRCEMG